MQISLSGWMRRLWTLHEGVLANELHIKFKDTTLDLHGAYAQVTAREHQHRNRVGCWAGSPEADASQTYWRMRSLRSEPGARVPRQLFGVRRVLTAADPVTVNVHKRNDRIMRAFEASRFRTTSRVEDTYICLANLLDWNPTDLASVPVQRRMRLLLEQEANVPQGLLFIPGPRSDEPGWGWSVVDFDHESQSRMLASIGDTTPAPRDARGITVLYPALVLPSFSDLGTNLEFVLPIEELAHVGPHQCWWRITSLDHALQQLTTQASSASKTICVVYYNQLPSEIPSIPMAAAMLAVDQHELISQDPATPVVAAFICVAMVEKVGTTNDLDALLKRTDLHLGRIAEPARIVRRHWTIG